LAQQDEYYYEIQLTNKQLVFYFMAGAAFLVMSFLAGIVVGRGVDSTAEATTVQAAPVRAAAATEGQDVIVPVKDESQTKGAAASAQDLNFGQLESDQKNYQLDKGTGTGTASGASGNTKSAMAEPLVAVPPSNAKPAGNNASRTSAPPAAKTTAPVKQPQSVKDVASAPTSKPAAPATKPAAGAKAGAQAKPAAPPAPVAGGFTIQVGAFKDRATAESIVSRLKGKGFSAYVVTPEGAAGGLFNVRVGSFKERPQAEKTEARLRDDEKFKPFIVKQ
jgi:cell division septation protein DedD